jgi:hypothetical protein
MAKQLDQIQLKNQQNNNAVTPLQRYNIQTTADTFNKSFVELPLLTNQLIGKWSDLSDFINNAYNDDDIGRLIPAPWAYEFTFNDMPDWAIPMINIIPVISIADTDWINNNVPRTLNKFLFDYRVEYFWEKKDNTNYKLYVYLYNDSVYNFSPYAYLPVYIDLSGWFVNKNYRNTTQHNLGKY